MAKSAQIDSTLSHSFSVAMATKYGLFEAILINHIKHWLSINAENDVCYKDGRYWTFQKISTIEKTYPYVSRRTIERALQKLVDCKVLLKGNYNDSRLNRVMWYSFTDEFSAQIVIMDCDNLTQSGYDKMTQSTTTDCHNPLRQNDVIKNDTINSNSYKGNDTKDRTLHKTRSRAFVPPTLDEVEAYCFEKGYGFDPETFIAYYTASGWMRGKTPIKDWKACCVTWERKRKSDAKAKRSADDEFYERWANA